MKEQPESEDYRDTNRFDYHYNRQERLSKLPEQLRGKISGLTPRGIFRRNRTVSVILVDLMIIAVVWFIFLPLIRTGANGRVDGYLFSLHSFSYGGNALISLTVVNESGKEGSVPGYSATFGLSSSDRTIEMRGLLPRGAHASATLRARLPLTGRTTAVVCIVTLAGKKLSLKARLQRE
jgi:hypothetical protein